jgi:hypothetical protein
MAAQREPSAAAALYPHLPSAERPDAKWVGRERTPFAQSMYPRPQTRPPNPYRESLLRGLRETSAKLRRR